MSGISIFWPKVLAKWCLLHILAFVILKPTCLSTGNQAESPVFTCGLKFRHFGILTSESEHNLTRETSPSKYL